MANVLKDVNGDISKHLRSHVHLTNCIHLKNQIHKNRPIFTDTYVHPSASPSLRQSPSATDLISKGGENGKKLKKNGMQIESANFNYHFRGKLSQNGNMGEETETSIRGYNRGLDRGKRRKFHSTRRTQFSKTPKNEVAQNKMPWASDIFAQIFGGKNGHLEGGEIKYDEQNLTIGSINKRGRERLFRNESHPKLKNGGLFSKREDSVDSSLSIKCDEEALPLLVEVAESQQSNNNEYSGELGIYAYNLLNHEKSGDQQRLRRHQSLTQKYVPKTFEDIVGQKLVSQALLNSIAKRKIGFAYLFYGPHGTGKTSAARVFARALNCQSVGKIKPCSFCNFCKAYDKGKTRNIKEMGSFSNFDFERIMEIINNMRVSLFPSQYKVFIFDDCDKISIKCWRALSKVMDRAPRRVVFILVCSSLDFLPHVIISMCQKFLFQKLKDADIIHVLRSIATKEVLDIDENALKIIASRSDGSLRDAEMSLEQLSLLGQKITVSLVQELVGLTSDENLMNLLDLALSDDTVNTVKSLREIMESGVEPLMIMSQIATVITDILAGTYDLTRESSRRKFFQKQSLSREQMEKLRQALKTLSEAEKHLKISNDKSTSLISTLLQLAPDQQYILPNLNHGSIFQGDGSHRKGTVKNAQTQDNYTTKKRNKISSTNPEQSTSLPTDINKISDKQLSDIVYKDIEQIWSEVLEKIQARRLREFLYKEGKLVSVRFDKVPIVQLMFSSQLTKSKAENYKAHLLQAFESVLGSPLRIEIKCELKETVSQPFIEIACPEEAKNIKRKNKNKNIEVRDPEITVAGDDESSRKKDTITSVPEGSNLGEKSQNKSLVKRRVTLAQVIEQVENSRSNRKAVSIAEELEWENLRLEPRTRSLLCCKVPRGRQRKYSHSKIRNRKPIILTRYVGCGKCLSSTSPR